MSSPALATIKGKLNISSKYPNKHERKISSYTAVVNYLLRQYGIDAVTGKPDKDIKNFKQGLLTP